jgi:hypothetical protein
MLSVTTHGVLGSRLMPALCDIPRNAEQAKYLVPWIRSLIFRSNGMKDRAPWIVFAAREHVRSRLGPGKRVFEYGSGGSTFWFADHGCSVISVEHDAMWHKEIVGRLSASEQERVECLLIPPERGSISGSSVSNEDECSSADSRFEGYCFKQYVSAVDSYPDESFDVIMVDGRARGSCLVRGFPKVREGGLIVLDDSDRHRYRTAMNTLPVVGRRDYKGPGAYSRWYWQTTIWEKRG